MRVIAGAGSYSPPAAGEQAAWVEHLRVTDLSVGTYSVAAGGADDQTPHSEDEIYVVATGRAVLEAAGERAQVGPGSVIYVAAGEPHRFTEITEDLAVVVLFGPAEYSRSGEAQPG
jgi:mannose-6-phosphate isomerase-like protein (cupin superfamily)